MSKASGEMVTLGIDLGTTNSVVSVVRDDQVTVIPVEGENKTLPSVVTILANGRKKIGREAVQVATMNPTRTISSVKRFMGRRNDEVGEEAKLVAYEVVGAGDEPVRIKIDKREWKPAEISALVLGKLKKAAEEYLGMPVKHAVITVPAYFNDAQRQATIDAAKIAGFETKWTFKDPGNGETVNREIRIIAEPTAAAIAYAKKVRRNEKVVVFDLGGGTFDVSVLSSDGKGYFTVLGTSGDSHLGGDDFDQVVVNWLSSEFERQNKCPLKDDPTVRQRLREAAEQAKKNLSAAQSTHINIPFLDLTSGAGIDVELSRDKFDSLVKPLIQRCVAPIEEALKRARVTAKDVAEVVMVGGMTRVPAVREFVKATFGKEGNLTVNPDEVVSVGAAMWGYELSRGSQSNTVVLDVTPLDLGIETKGGAMERIIDAGKSIPCEGSKTFQTVADNQAEVVVAVYQGNRPVAKNNKRLGDVTLSGLPPAPAGVVQIEVKFSLDVNGVLSVSAKDLGTNKSVTTTIKATSGMEYDDIERARREAQEAEQQDAAMRELIDLRLKAEADVAKAKTLMTTVIAAPKAKKPSTKKTPATKAPAKKTTAKKKPATSDDATDPHALAAEVASVEALMQEGTANDLRAALERLSKVSTALGTSLYANK